MQVLRVFVLVLLSLTSGGVVLAEENNPQLEDGTPCEFTAGGQTTWKHLHKGQCLPVACLDRCSRHTSTLLLSPEGVADGGKTLTMTLLQCASWCLVNDDEHRPVIPVSDMECRHRVNVPASDAGNWRTTGRVCSTDAKRACIQGQCVEAVDFVLRALNSFFSYSLKFYLKEGEEFAALQPPRYRMTYENQAQRFLARALLRPPGTLKRPDWKALQKAEFEKRKLEEEKQLSESKQ